MSDEHSAANCVRSVWSFSSPSQIFFGRGAVENVASVCRRMGKKHAVIVTDKQMIEVGIVAPIQRSLEKSGLSVYIFDGGAPEPSVDLVEACASTLRTEAANVDVIISVGGGSNTDLAKGVSTILSHGGSIRDYFGEDMIPGPIIPLVSVSTTAGTGSEVSGVAVLDDPANETKLGISSQYIRPLVAIYDPALTLSCPRSVTASAGIDALTHAIEVYVAKDHSSLPIPQDVQVQYQGKNQYTDTLALKAIQLIGKHLRTAFHNGDNYDAREQVHLASLLAGLAFSNGGLGAVHAIQLPIGTLTKTPHGLGNGVLLPYVMEYNLSARPGLFAEIAHALGQETAGLSLLEAAAKSVEAVRALRKDIGIPETLRELGVGPDDIQLLSEKVIATQQRLLRCNPRPLDQHDIESILKNAVQGVSLLGN